MTAKVRAIRVITVAPGERLTAEQILQATASMPAGQPFVIDLGSGEFDWEAVPHIRAVVDDGHPLDVRGCRYEGDLVAMLTAQVPR